MEEINNYGGNNYIYHSNNCSQKKDSDSSSFTLIKYIYPQMNNSSKINKIYDEEMNCCSWQFEPKILYGQQKGVLESKLDNLVDNINRFIYKIDMQRIESKKQHANLINELRADRALSEQNLNRFMVEMKKERNIFMDEMKKERIQSNQQHKEIIDILNKALNNKKKDIIFIIKIIMIKKT